MKSNYLFYAALSLAAAEAQASPRVVMTVVGDINPLRTVVSAVLDSAPAGRDYSYFPSSADPSILFSACSLTFNSTNYNVPQKITLRRKAFTPFITTDLRSGNNTPVPPQIFNLVLSESAGSTMYTLPLRWDAVPGRIVSWWGDPHFDATLNDKNSNGQGNFLDKSIVTMPRDKYYSVLKSKSDWEVVMRTAPYGLSATVHNRLCVRYGNNAICVNPNGSLTYLNPSAQDAFPIEVQKVGSRFQFLLPSGSAVETIFGASFTSRISIQPSDFGGLVGIGNTTDIGSFSTSTDAGIGARRLWIEKFVFSNATQNMFESKNLTDGLQFSNSTGSPLGYSACIPGVSNQLKNFYRMLTIATTTTMYESTTSYLQKTLTFTKSVDVNVTSMMTKWTTATQTTVVSQGTTLTNLMTALTTVTDITTSQVTSTVVQTSTDVLSAETTVSSEALATSTQTLSRTNMHTSEVTVVREHNATVTDVHKKTLVFTENIKTTQVDLIKATSVVKGDDIINTVLDHVTDTIQNTNFYSTTLIRKHIETMTIEEQDFADKTQTIVLTQQTDAHHFVTNVVTNMMAKYETMTHHLTDDVEVEVTDLVTDVIEETTTHSHTSTLVISTDILVKSTKTHDVQHTVRNTETHTSKTTSIYNAYSTRVIIDNASVTVTDSIDQIDEVGETNYLTSTRTAKQINTNTKFITHGITATSHVTSTSTAIIHATSTVIHSFEIHIDDDLGKTISLAEEIAAADAIVFTTIFNPVVVYVTANHTDGTITNTNWFTVTATNTFTAGAIYTTIGA